MATINVSYLPDGYNTYTLEYNNVRQNPKTNKSTIDIKGTLHLVRNGYAKSSTGNYITAYTSSQNLGNEIYGEADFVIECNNVEFTHDENGVLQNLWINGSCYGAWGSADSSGTISLPQIDRAGVSITNYALREVKGGKLSVNFTVNDSISNAQFRYKKSSSSTWESDWINYNTYDGSYDDNTKTGYFTTPGLSANTEYDIELKVIRSYNDVATTTVDSFETKGLLYFKNSSSWVNGEVYLKVNGVWKTSVPYLKVNGVWKEAS